MGAKGVNGEGKRLRLGRWAHGAVCSDVLLSCTLETCMVWKPMSPQ